MTQWLITYLDRFRPFQDTSLNRLTFAAFLLAIAASAGIGYTGITYLGPQYQIEPQLPAHIDNILTRMRVGHRLSDTELNQLFKFYTAQWEDAKRTTLTLQNNKERRAISYDIKVRWQGIPIASLFPYVGASHETLFTIASTKEPNIAPIMYAIYQRAGWYNYADKMHAIMLDERLHDQTATEEQNP